MDNIIIDSEDARVEIGKAERIELKDLSKFLIHIRGNPAEEADLIQRLLDQGETQAAIGHVMGLSQGAVSKRLRLRELIPILFERVRAGKLRPSTAYVLAKMPKAKQLELSKAKRLTLDGVQTEHRGQLVSAELTALLDSPLEQGIPKDTMPSYDQIVHEQLERRKKDPTITTVYVSLDDGLWGVLHKGDKFTA